MQRKFISGYVAHGFNPYTGKKVKNARSGKYADPRWKFVSKQVRERDGKCLKCGSKDKLTADHFKKICYINWKQFLNKNKIQTLCWPCHRALPGLKQRERDGWKKYCWLKSAL